MTLVRGMRIVAELFEARPPGSASLAGMQTKTAATMRIVSGVVTHIRGDHPTRQTSVGVWIETEDGQEVVVDSRAIVSAEAPS